MKLKAVSDRKNVTFFLQRQDQGWRRLAVLEATQEKMNNPPTSPTWNKMPQRWQWRKSDVYNQTKTIPALKPMLKFGNFIELMRLDKRKKDDEEYSPFQHNLAARHSELWRRWSIGDFSSCQKKLPINSWATRKNIKLKAANFSFPSYLFFNGISRTKFSRNKLFNSSDNSLDMETQTNLSNNSWSWNNSI